MINAWPEDALKNAVVTLENLNLNPLNILDVGAHYGETLDTLSNNLNDQFSYIGLEPDPDSFKKLKDLSSKESVKNKCPNPNLLNIAAGNNISTIEFIKTQADAVSGVLEPEAGLSERVKAGDHKVNDRFEVSLTTIDELIKKFSNTHINLLKIDTEGYDLECLRGAENSLNSANIDLIICETFFVKYRKGQCYFWDIAKHLHNKNYFFMNIYDSRDTDQGRLYTSNGIWVSHKIANQLNFL